LGRARPRVGGRARGSASAGEDDVGRLRAFLTLLGYELDLRALGEGLEALARDAAEWTKRSLPPSSGVMNPYPLASSNHFTVPVAICLKHLLALTHERAGRCKNKHDRTTL
jgi:hypothetical protein